MVSLNTAFPLDKISTHTLTRTRIIRYSRYKHHLMDKQRKKPFVLCAVSNSLEFSVVSVPILTSLTTRVKFNVPKH